ncbi:MAG: hypothetical protein H6631_01980 [Anaerolineaceae bacterium]|nr:hypothetical protein [Anaerolineaceae bacterium]
MGISVVLLLGLAIFIGLIMGGALVVGLFLIMSGNDRDSVSNARQGWLQRRSEKDE